jgi:hypothetical protein
MELERKLIPNSVWPHSPQFHRGISSASFIHQLVIEIISFDKVLFLMPRIQNQIKKTKKPMLPKLMIFVMT